MAKKWTAFLRLKGETQAEEEMLDEFSGFVQSIRGVDVDYNVIVFIEDEDLMVLGTQNSVHTSETCVRREGSGA
jgi:hypothetical protein